MDDTRPQPLYWEPTYEIVLALNDAYPNFNIEDIGMKQLKDMIATAASRYDLARFGAEVMRGSPRQSDLMIVSGTVTKKMVVPIVRLYNQMPEPKYVIAMGACASGGGPFKEGYHVVSGIDKFVPVDVYVPGCPPTPQALLNGLIALQKKIEGQSLSVAASVPWYGSGPNEEIP